SPNPLARKVDPWYIECTKKPSPFKWWVALPFYQGTVSFCFTIWKTRLSLAIFMTYGTAPFFCMDIDSRSLPIN
ncbi:hypothetical protein ACQKFM_26785, partial [Paenibacillus xylanexedens]|uniref:hypothetical protein n=1 Tax=Paenibacillus xylanexedens TaxID=528191 RepID=UPI003D02791E